MSSTNRGGSRHAADYYVTPQKPIHDFLCAMREDDPTQFGAQYTGLFQAMDTGIHVIDPCAGGDATTPMAYPLALKSSAWPKITSITTVDWRGDSPAEHRGTDFLMWEPSRQFDLAITNPPFDRAREIIDRCFQVVAPGGMVVMLLRLNYFGGEKRAHWWADNMPTVCYIHSKRIGFMGHMQADSPEFLTWRTTKSAQYSSNDKALASYRAQTDSIEYAHMVWIVGETPRFTAMRMI